MNATGNEHGKARNMSVAGQGGFPRVAAFRGAVAVAARWGNVTARMASAAALCGTMAVTAVTAFMAPADADAAASSCTRYWDDGRGRIGPYHEPNGGCVLKTVGPAYFTLTERARIETDNHSIWNQTGSSRGYRIEGTLEASGDNHHAIYNEDGWYNEYRLYETGSAETFGANASVIHNNKGAGNTYTIEGSVTAAGMASHGIWNSSSGGSHTYTISGTVSVTGAGAHGIYNDPEGETGGGGNTYTISGTLSATGSGAYAIYNKAGNNTFEIEADATVTGAIKTDVRATLLLGDNIDASTLGLEGDWRDGRGIRLTGSVDDMLDITVATAIADANGGYTMDGNDRLTVTETGSISATRDGSPAVVSEGVDNTYVISGDLNTAGEGGHAIHNQAGGSSEYIVSSTITARGANAHAIYNQAGGGNEYTIAGTGTVTARGAGAYAVWNRGGAGNRFVLADGAMVSGRLRTGVDDYDLAATLDIQLTGSWALDLEGRWQDTAGDAIRHTDRRGWLIVIGAGASETNGGHVLDGDDSLTVAAGGSIISAADNAHGIHSTGAGNVHAVAGGISTTGMAAHAIYNEDGGGNEYTVSGIVETDGEGAHAIYNQAGDGNSYAISGTVSATGVAAHAIYNQAGAGNTYTVMAEAEMTGVVKTDVRATLLLAAGFNDSRITLAGEWVDANGDAVVLNRGPVLAGELPEPDSAPMEGLPWFYLPDLAGVFMDEDGDSLAYAFADLPVWLTAAADSVTGAIIVAGTPPAGSRETSFTLTVTADDGRGRPPASAELAVAILAPPAGGGRSPTLENPIGSQQAVPGQEDFAVPLADVFADPHGGDLTIEAALADGADLPIWLALDRESAAAPRLFAAAVGSANSYVIRVTATNDDGFMTFTDFTLTIAEPEVEPAGFMAVDDSFSFTRGESLVGNVLRNDSDANRDAPTVASFWIPGDAANRVAAGGSLTLDELGELTLGADGAFSLELNDTAKALGEDESATAMVAYLASAATAAGMAGMGMDMIDEADPAVGVLTLTVRGSAADANVAPTRGWPVLPALTAYAGLPFRHDVPGNAFWDDDSEPLRYAVTAVGGGALPAWLDSAAAGMGILSGVPAAEHVSATAVALTLTATDAAGAAVEVQFSLTVAAMPVGTLTVADGTATLGLSYVAVSAGMVGGVPPCLELTLTAPAANLSAWSFEVDEADMACGLPAGTVGVPLLDGAGNLDVPLAKFTPAGGTETCLAMQFRYEANMFRLTASAAVTCPAP